MSTNPQDDRTDRPADLERARLWLEGHQLSDVPPTTLLSKRLAGRQSARVAGHLLLAAFIVVVALVYSGNRHAHDTADEPFGNGSLLLLTGVVAALVVAQALLDRRVRRIDRQAGAELRRRVAHVARPSWRTVLGFPRAALAAATFAGATALTVGALISPAPGVRYAATVLLIALCGVAAVMLIQLRHVLTRPAVADDEASLTADVLLRNEDAREVATPTMVWCLPWSMPATAVADTALSWWNTAWITLIVLGAVTLVSLTFWSAKRGTAPRRSAVGR